MARRSVRPLSEQEKSELIKSLQAEYELIQTKIDNIGNFKFVVRGWLITIYSALIFALCSDALPASLTLPIGFVVVLIFHLLEREQIIIQNKLSNRSKLIESSIYKFSLSRYSQGGVQAAVLRKLRSVPRISAVLTAKRIFNIFEKDDPWPSGIKKRTIWLLRRSWQGITWFISFKIYWLFIILYLLTIGIHFVLNDGTMTGNFGLHKANNNNDSGSEINIFNSNEENHNHKQRMRANASIEKVEEEMYSLASQIDYGDISDIDTYWESLRESLRDLEIEGWFPDSSLPSGYLVGTLPVEGSDELCEIISRMKELCKSGSNSSISDEKLEELQDLAIEFETKFEKVLDELDKIAKK